MKSSTAITDNMSSLLQQVSNTVRENPEDNIVFNWNEISKRELPDLFIEEHHQYLNWDTMSRYARFSLPIIQKYEYLINFGFLVLNKNNTSEVLSAYIDKMDWETAQKEQNLTPELLDRFRDSLDVLVILQHQKLTEPFIMTLLEPYIKEKNWDMVRKYLTIVFTYQKVSTEFIMALLRKELEINEAATVDVPEIILVDLPIVVGHQELSPEFLKTFCMEFTEVRREICKSQKLSSAFIAEHFDKLNTRRLLKYQQMDRNTLERIFNHFIRRPVVTDSMVQALTGSTSGGVAPPESSNSADRRFIIANALVNNQVYDIELFKKIVDEFVDHPRWQEVLWGNIFLRTLSPIGNKKYLGIGTDTVTQEIIPRVNWRMVAECELEPDQVENIINTTTSMDMPWYIFVRKHHLTEAQINRLDAQKYLTHMSWWFILNGNSTRPTEKKLSELFMRKHAAKLLWVPQVTDHATFYQAWLRAKDNMDNIDDADPQERYLLAEIREFISAYVAKAPWNKILREVQLPEWAMRIFAEYSDKIDMYWWKISRYQKLTAAFIKRHIDRLDLQILLGYQDMPEDFLRETSPFFTEENWDAIARHQKLTPQFLTDFADKLPATELAKNSSLK